MLGANIKHCLSYVDVRDIDLLSITKKWRLKFFLTIRKLIAVILEYLERMHYKVSSDEAKLLISNSVSFLESIILWETVNIGEVVWERCVYSTEKGNISLVCIVTKQSNACIMRLGCSLDSSSPWDIAYIVWSSRFNEMWGILTPVHQYCPKGNCQILSLLNSGVCCCKYNVKRFSFGSQPIGRTSTQYLFGILSTIGGIVI